MPQIILATRCDKALDLVSTWHAVYMSTLIWELAHLVLRSQWPSN